MGMIATRMSEPWSGAKSRTVSGHWGLFIQLRTRVCAPEHLILHNSAPAMTCGQDGAVAAYEAEVAAAELAAKRQRVAAAEADWLQVGAGRNCGAGECKPIQPRARAAHGGRRAIWHPTCSTCWLPAAGRMQLCRASGAWHPPVLQELQAKLALKAQQAVAGAAAAAAKKGGGGGLFNFRGLVTTILGNLQLKLSNVHVRCVPGGG